MDKERRKRVDEIIQKIEDLKSEVDEILNEEIYDIENIPENMQQSEEYEKADANCGSLQDAIDSIEEVVSLLEELQY